MNRLGIGPEELPHAARRAERRDAGAGDEPPRLRLRREARDERACSARASSTRRRSFPKRRCSLAATAGALIGADYHFDLIRPGIGLYGSGGARRGQSAARRRRHDRSADPASARRRGRRNIRLWRDLHRATKDAHRHRRARLRRRLLAVALRGRGYGVSAGAKRPILGRVSMDLIIIDVTGCAEAQPGAMVEFLGPNAPLDDVAALAGTAPTKCSPRSPAPCARPERARESVRADRPRRARRCWRRSGASPLSPAAPSRACFAPPFFVGQFVRQCAQIGYFSLPVDRPHRRVHRRGARAQHLCRRRALQRRAIRAEHRRARHHARAWARCSPA